MLQHECQYWGSVPINSHLLSNSNTYLLSNSKACWLLVSPKAHGGVDVPWLGMWLRLNTTIVSRRQFVIITDSADFQKKMVHHPPSPLWPSLPPDRGPPPSREHYFGALRWSRASFAHLLFCAQQSVGIVHVTIRCHKPLAKWLVFLMIIFKHTLLS